jgi:AhpC/TSA family.
MDAPAIEAHRGALAPSCARYRILAMSETERPPRLHVGDLAPNITLARTTGEKVTLSDLLRQGPILLVFLRHFG